MTQQKIIASLSICILIFAGCTGNKHEERNTKSKPVYESKASSLSYIENIKDLNQIISLLDNSNSLQGERVGINGEQSFSYSLYKRLCVIATDSILLQLTDHKNPKIRIYAMWALTSKNRRLALAQMKQLTNDRKQVVYEDGCTNITATVAWLAASRFDSTEITITP